MSYSRIVNMVDWEKRKIVSVALDSNILTEETEVSVWHKDYKKVGKIFLPKFDSN